MVQMLFYFAIRCSLAKAHVEEKNLTSNVWWRPFHFSLSNFIVGLTGCRQPEKAAELGATISWRWPLRSHAHQGMERKPAGNWPERMLTVWGEAACNGTLTEDLHNPYPDTPYP